MVLALKLLTLIGGLTALFFGLFMLTWMEKFMAFNEFVNSRYFIGSRYTYDSSKIDQWLFGKSYILAVILTIVGITLLTQFVRYAPYWQ
jgi:hypothetical protein